MSIHIYKHFFCIIPKNDDEIPERYSFRCHIISKQLETIETQNDFDELLRLSNYASNIHFLKCSYSDQINEKCNKLIFNVQH